MLELNHYFNRNLVSIILLVVVVATIAICVVPVLLSAYEAAVALADMLKVVP